MDTEQAEIIALKALTFLAADTELMDRFAALSAWRQMILWSAPETGNAGRRNGFSAVRRSGADRFLRRP